MTDRTPEQQVAHGKYMAVVLSDLEFETLIRERIRNLYSKIPFLEELHDSYNTVTFNYTPTGSDPAKWTARIGAGYSNQADSTGEILHQSLEDSIDAYSRKKTNKLSLLLTNE
jgi:hypothetical protein